MNRHGNIFRGGEKLQMKTAAGTIICTRSSTKRDSFSGARCSTPARSRETVNLRGKLNTEKRKEKEEEKRKRKKEEKGGQRRTEEDKRRTKDDKKEKKQRKGALSAGVPTSFKRIITTLHSERLTAERDYHHKFFFACQLHFI